MKLSLALLELREKDHILGVYRELLDHIDDLIKNEAQIPIYNSTEEFVDMGYLEEVREEMQVNFDVFMAEREKILNWNVGGEEDVEHQA